MIRAGLKARRDKMNSKYKRLVEPYLPIIVRELKKALGREMTPSEGEELLDVFASAVEVGLHDPACARNSFIKAVKRTIVARRGRHALDFLLKEREQRIGLRAKSRWSKSSQVYSREDFCRDILDVLAQFEDEILEAKKNVVPHPFNLLVRRPSAQQSG